MPAKPFSWLFAPSLKPEWNVEETEGSRQKLIQWRRWRFSEIWILYRWVEKANLYSTLRSALTRFPRAKKRLIIALSGFCENMIGDIDISRLASFFSFFFFGSWMRSEVRLPKMLACRGANRRKALGVAKPATQETLGVLGRYRIRRLGVLKS